MLRRSRAKTIALCACAIGAFFFILSQLFGGPEGIPSGTPPVVIVTVLDSDNYSKDYINNIKDNRIEYARKHGKICGEIVSRTTAYTINRIYNFLPKHQGLRLIWLSYLLVACASDAPCPDKIPA